MTPDYRQLAQVFSAESFRGLSTPCGPAAVRATITRSGVPGLARRMRLGTLFDRALEQLLQSYRNEYVFANAITNQLLLRKHGCRGAPATARLVAEFWVGDVRADLAIFDDTSSVYEIKTEFDSLVRLPRQLEGYSRLFDRVYVVTSPVMCGSILAATPAHVGVLNLGPTGELVQLRPAASNLDRVDTRVICRAMRELEVLDICRRLTGQPLDMSNGVRVQACWEIFSTLSPLEAHREMVNAIRVRRIHQARQDLVAVAPYSLKHLCLSKTMNVAQFKAILPRLDLVV